MKLPFLLLSAVLAGSWLFPASVQQEPECGKRADMVKALLLKYREKQRALGIANPTTVIEIFTSASGTWTILLTRSDGASCIVSAGQDWEEMPPPQPYTTL
jgi:hypothetical protein